MYIPKHFEVSDPALLQDLIRNRPLATVVTHGRAGLSANLIPLHLATDPAPYGTLRGHVARANPLLADTQEACPTLAIFHGPERYITPSWYPTKREHGKVVPTWNYAVVQAHGTLRAVDDPGWLREQLAHFTRQHESALPHPWSIHDAPAAYVDQIIQAVVGVEMVVERLVGKWKISQNQPPQNRDSVVRHLRATGEADAAWMADQMEKWHED